MGKKKNKLLRYTVSAVYSTYDRLGRNMLVSLPIMLFPYSHKIYRLCFPKLCSRVSTFCQSILYTVEIFEQSTLVVLWRVRLGMRLGQEGAVWERDYYRSIHVPSQVRAWGQTNLAFLVPSMLALCSMLARPYYTTNYAGIIRPTLLPARPIA